VLIFETGLYPEASCPTTPAVDIDTAAVRRAATT